MNTILITTFQTFFGTDINNDPLLLVNLTFPTHNLQNIKNWQQYNNNMISLRLPVILVSKSARTAKELSHNFHALDSTINREMYCSEVDIGSIDCSSSSDIGKLLLFPTMVEFQSRTCRLINKLNIYLY